MSAEHERGSLLAVKVPVSALDEDEDDSQDSQTTPSQANNKSASRNAKERRSSARAKKQRISFSPDSVTKPVRGKRKKKPGVKTKPVSYTSATRPYDKLPNGQPFSCHLCKSPYVTNPFAKGVKKNKRSRHVPYPRKHKDLLTGKEMMLCNACGLSFNKPPRIVKPKVVISEEDRREYLRTAREFTKSLAEMFNKPTAEKLYCPPGQRKLCGCLQKYIKGTVETEDSIAGRVTELTDMMEEARVLQSQKSYSESLESAKGKAKKYRKIGFGNGHKRSKQYEEFVLQKREFLKSELRLCERATQRILMYSNNFLHKKRKTEASSRRIVRTKGKGVLGLLPAVDCMHQKHCCIDNCVSMAITHPNLLKKWRERAAKGQAEARHVVAEMLTPAGGTRLNCYQFITLVTGCCSSTIGRVNNQMKVTRGVRDPPVHGMKKFWQENQVIKDVPPPAVPRGSPRSHTETCPSTTSGGPTLVTETQVTQQAAPAPGPTVTSDTARIGQNPEWQYEAQRQQLLQLQQRIVEQQAQLQQQQQLLEQQLLQQTLAQQQQLTASQDGSTECLVPLQQLMGQMIQAQAGAQQSTATDVLQLQIPLQPSENLRLQQHLLNQNQPVQNQFQLQNQLQLVQNQLQPASNQLQLVTSQTVPGKSVQIEPGRVPGTGQVVQLSVAPDAQILPANQKLPVNVQPVQRLQRQALVNIGQQQLAVQLSQAQLVNQSISGPVHISQARLANQSIPGPVHTSQSQLVNQSNEGPVQILTALEQQPVPQQASNQITVHVGNQSFTGSLQQAGGQSHIAGSVQTVGNQSLFTGSVQPIGNQSLIIGTAGSQQQTLYDSECESLTDIHVNLNAGENSVQLQKPPSATQQTGAVTNGQKELTNQNLSTQYSAWNLLAQDPRSPAGNQYTSQTSQSRNVLSVGDHGTLTSGQRGWSSQVVTSQPSGQNTEDTLSSNQELVQRFVREPVHGQGGVEARLGHTHSDVLQTQSPSQSAVTHTATGMVVEAEEAEPDSELQLPIQTASPVASTAGSGAAPVSAQDLHQVLMRKQTTQMLYEVVEQPRSDAGVGGPPGSVLVPVQPNVYTYTLNEDTPGTSCQPEETNTAASELQARYSQEDTRNPVALDKSRLKNSKSVKGKSGRHQAKKGFKKIRARDGKIYLHTSDNSGERTQTAGKKVKEVHRAGSESVQVVIGNRNNPVLQSILRAPPKFVGNQSDRSRLTSSREPVKGNKHSTPSQQNIPIDTIEPPATFGVSMATEHVPMVSSVTSMLHMAKSSVQISPSGVFPGQLVSQVIPTPQPVSGSPTNPISGIAHSISSGGPAPLSLSERGPGGAEQQQLTAQLPSANSLLKGNRQGQTFQLMANAGHESSAVTELSRPNTVTELSRPNTVTELSRPNTVSLQLTEQRASRNQVTGSLPDLSLDPHSVHTSTLPTTVGGKPASVSQSNQTGYLSQPTGSQMFVSLGTDMGLDTLQNLTASPVGNFGEGQVVMTFPVDQSTLNVQSQNSLVQNLTSVSSPLHSRHHRTVPVGRKNVSRATKATTITGAMPSVNLSVPVEPETQSVGQTVPGAQSNMTSDTNCILLIPQLNTSQGCYSATGSVGNSSVQVTGSQDAALPSGYRLVQSGMAHPAGSITPQLTSSARSVSVGQTPPQGVVPTGVASPIRTVSSSLRLVPAGGADTAGSITSPGMQGTGELSMEVLQTLAQQGLAVKLQTMPDNLHGN